MVKQLLKCTVSIVLCQDFRFNRSGEALKQTNNSLGNRRQLYSRSTGQVVEKQLIKQQVCWAIKNGSVALPKVSRVNASISLSLYLGQYIGGYSKHMVPIVLGQFTTSSAAQVSRRVKASGSLHGLLPPFYYFWSSNSSATKVYWVNSYVSIVLGYT